MVGIHSHCHRGYLLAFLKWFINQPLAHTGLKEDKSYENSPQVIVFATWKWANVLEFLSRWTSLLCVRSRFVVSLTQIIKIRKQENFSYRSSPHWWWKIQWFKFTECKCQRIVTQVPYSSYVFRWPQSRRAVKFSYNQREVYQGKLS